MGSPVEHRQASDPQPAADIADGDHLEPAIVHPGLGRDPHGTAQVGAVGNRNGADPALQHRTVVQPEAHRGIAMTEQADHGGGQEIHRSAERRGPACRPRDHLGADAGVGNIDEVPASGRGRKPARVERAPAIRRQPGRHLLRPPRAGHTAAKVGAGAALQEADSRRTAAGAAKQAVDDFMGGAVAAHRDHESIAGRGSVVRGIAAPRSLHDLDGNPHRGAGGGAALPEAAGSTATGRRVDDYERARIRRVFSTSCAICCRRAGTEANRFSARSRCTNQTFKSRS